MNVRLHWVHLTSNMVIINVFTLGASKATYYHNIHLNMFVYSASDVKRYHQVFIYSGCIRHQMSSSNVRLQLANLMSNVSSRYAAWNSTHLHCIGTPVSVGTFHFHECRVLNANTMACCWSVKHFSKVPFGYFK